MLSRGGEYMTLWGSLILFLILFGNVALGAFFNSAFLGDIGELLMLGASSILFVIAILQKEAAAKNKAAD